jgi:hypothetical protein
VKALASKPEKRGNGKRGPDVKPRRKRTDGTRPPPGKGRVVGSKLPLPLGSVASIKGLRYRVPDGTPEPLGEVADEALQAVVDVMRRGVRRGAMAVLGAAKTVREEVCGAITQKHEIAVTQSLAERIEEARARAKR